MSVRVHIAFAVVVSCVAGSLWAARPLTFEERVKAQEAIERVYYAHRIWPRENPDPKPAFESAITRDELAAKVERALLMNAALESYWGESISAENLQAELDRMARQTRDPAVLSEVFAALGNDPTLLAESLARPLYVERRCRAWFTADRSIHRLTEERARRALDLTSGRLVAESPDEALSCTTYVLGPVRGEEVAEEGRARVVTADRLRELSEEFGPGGAPSLKEDESSFQIRRRVEVTPESLTVEILRIPKTRFEVWLERVSPHLELTLPSVAGEPSFELPTILVAGTCRGEWLPTAIGMEVEPQSGHTAVWSGQEMIIWGGGSAGGGRYNPASDSWTPTSGGFPAPHTRTGHTAVWTGTEMIIWGGYAQGVSPYYFNTGARYNPATDTWTETSTGTSCPAARHKHTSVWTGSEMIVWGGVGASNVWIASGGRYNPTTDSWTATRSDTTTPRARAYHTALWTGTQMIILGGETATGPVATGARYTPSTNTWVPQPGPKPLYKHSAVWTGTEIILWGGLDFSDVASNLGWRLNPSGSTWTAISTGAGCPTARSGHVALWTGTRMVIWGGGSSYNSGALYDPASDSWTATSTAGSCPQLSSFSGVWTGQEMLVYGSTSSAAAGARYNPTTDSWTPISQAKSTSYASADPATVWTGAEMFLWGGLDGDDNRYPYYAAIYRPATGTWSRYTMPTGTSEFPGVAGQTDLPAIWTGAEVIVWGGTVTRSGLIFDPLRTLWRRTAGDPGAPLSRVHHSLVWTGTEMVVWGGHNDHYFHFSNGGRYNPRTDSWRSLSMGPGCPTPRSRHSTVWTGSEMIVWGGQWQADSFGPLVYRGDGARYSPATDTWTPLPSPGTLLTARVRHAAIWTGDSMLLWGGFDGAPFSTGAIFHPGSNSWTAISSGANCPTARQRPVCAWTGSEMIIWGGDPGSFPYRADGARYDPTAGTWVPMDSVHLAPVARTGAASVWTGSSLLLWGGKHLPNAVTYTGGEYLPGPLVSGPTHLCGLPSITLSTGEFSSYQWLRDGQPLPGATSRTLSVTTGGEFSVRVQDSAGLSCTSPTLSVEAAPAPTIQAAGSPCATAALSTQPFASYQWYRDGASLSGQTTRTCTAALPGSYTVAVTDDAGCGGTSAPFAVHPSIKPVITKIGSCATGWLDAGPGYDEYQWWGWSDPVCGATERFFRAEDGEGYRVRVRSGECFAFSDWFAIGNPPSVTIQPSSPRNTCPSLSVRISTPAVGTAYQWAYRTWDSNPSCDQDAGIPVPGATLPYLDAYDTGHYWVYVTDGSGCTSVGKVSLQTTFCTGAEACPAGSQFPLRLEKSNVSPTGYYLILGPGNGASLNFYEGTLGQWYSHGNRTDWACYPPYESESLPDRTQRVPFVPSEGNRYYLLTSITNGTSGLVEGPSGYASSGAEIDPAQNTCAP